MAIHDYLQPANKGKQVWQTLASNLTSGTHPYNVKGFCAALVAQWLLEIHFAAGARPDELGRYLLQGRLGAHGYGGIASSQRIYGSLNPEMNNHSALIHRHTGGSLARGHEIQINSHEHCWRLVREKIYNDHSLDDALPPGRHARVYSAYLGLYGTFSWPLSWLAGNGWGHAIGLHSDGVRIYIFDPNYGVFIFHSEAPEVMANFFRDLWDQYRATSGNFARVKSLCE